MKNQTTGDAKNALFARRLNADGDYKYAARVDPEDEDCEWKGVDDERWYADYEIADDWEILRVAEETTPRSLLQAVWDAAHPLPDDWSFHENQGAELIYRSFEGRFSVGRASTGFIFDRTQYRLLDEQIPAEVKDLADDLTTLLGDTQGNTTDIARALIEGGYKKTENI